MHLTLSTGMHCSRYCTLLSPCCEGLAYRMLEFRFWRDSDFRDVRIPVAIRCKADLESGEISLGCNRHRASPRTLARKMHRLGWISHKVLIFYGIMFAAQISAVFAEPHWPAHPAMIVHA